MVEFPWGGTDCALPMLDALEKKMPVDVFLTITDNETWSGNTHPSEALNKYRKEMGIDSKLIVCGMTSTGFSIGDPNDKGTLNVVGFDSATPSIISNFAKGLI
jgi:60 kDa SS-A/Ro ribonucleoprotein